MARTNGRDRDPRSRAEAVIPGGMYGHQSTGLPPDDYPQVFERGEGALGALKRRSPTLQPVPKRAFLTLAA